MTTMWKKSAAILLAAAMAVTMSGCDHGKKDKESPTPKPTVSATPQQTEKKSETVDATGEGRNKSDVPLIVGYESMDDKMNPFMKLGEANRRAVEATQISLLTFDRDGAVINQGIDGEKRSYNGEDYTYYAPCNLKIKYKKKKDQTCYTIELRQDIVFSNNENTLTADDLMFSLYAFCDSSYHGDLQIGSEPIVGLARYQQKDSVKRIEGIVKLDDYTVTVTTKGYDPEFVRSLDIPICPLYYYGDEKKYDCAAGQMGFTKGDLSGLLKEKTPVGAGPYKFIKYEKGIAYYEANTAYYQGCPKTAFLQIKNVGKLSVEKRTQYIQAGEANILPMEGDKESIDQIVGTNSNGKSNGGSISTRLTDGDRYSYIVINADSVNIDDRGDSTRSKNLRKALATLFASERQYLLEEYNPASAVINYPNAATSWSVPQPSDEEFARAYSTDKDGDVIYESDMEQEERGQAACEAALGFLKKAGYKVKNGKVVSAPGRHLKTFTIYLDRESKDLDLYQALADTTKGLFEQIGLKLKINTSLHQDQITRMSEKGKLQIFVQTSQTRCDGALYEMYHDTLARDEKAGSQNVFGITDSDLDDYIERAMETVDLKKKTRLYAKCYKKVLDWGVEVPLYQERDITIFSSYRINMETVTPNITRYYSWWDELQNVEMN